MNRCIVGDFRDVLPTIEAGSIHCSVTSPPYDNLRSYKALTWDDFEIVAHELYRVLCDGGVLCWNVNDSVVNGGETLTSAKQKIYFAERVGFRVHDTMIYEKNNFAHPERVRYHQMFEYVFILSKGEPRCFNPIKDKRNTYAGTGTYGKNTATQRDGSKIERKRNLIAEFGMRGNVWCGRTAGQENICEELVHPAQMPLWLARDLILSWSNPGDTILDPMAGSGTTGEGAEMLGRSSILIDVEPRFAKSQHERTAQRGLVLA